MTGRRTRLIRFVASALISHVAVSAALAQSIEIEEVVWGFDGKVVPNEFNPLSVRVHNRSPENFDGQLQLRKYTGGENSRKGAVIVEPVFVSPFSRRWVQFYPFIQREHEEWHISWQPGLGGELKRRTPLHGARAHVVLEADGTFNGGGSLRALREELFPPFVSATVGLASVSLDHQPQRWEEPRQQSLIDWLHSGGELHILHDATTGEFPKFEGLLAELNTPVDKFRLGAGTVYRHPRIRRELSRKFVDEVIIRPADEPQQAETEDEDATADIYNYEPTMDFSNIHQNFLKKLKGMTRPEHNWLLIHAMSVVYIIVIFPGCWYIGRRWRDYRITLGVLLATVALFGLGFHKVGEQSYDAAATVTSVAIARPLADGDMLVTSWSNIFGTSKSRPKVAVAGGNSKIYDVISHVGQGRLYSTGQEIEAVSGFIENGVNGKCLFDIPPFSSRETVSRYKTTLKPIDVKVESWQSQDGLPRVELSVGGAFPTQSYQMYALYGRNVYHANKNGNRVTLSTSAGELSTFLAKNNMSDMQHMGIWNQDQRPPEQIYLAMSVSMIARQLGINNQKEAKRFQLRDGRLRLFVFADLPEEFAMSNPAFTLQTGRVMYCIDVFNPDET